MTWGRGPVLGAARRPSPRGGFLDYGLSARNDMGVRRFAGSARDDMRQRYPRLGAARPSLTMRPRQTLRPTTGRRPDSTAGDGTGARLYCQRQPESQTLRAATARARNRPLRVAGRRVCFLIVASRRFCFPVVAGRRIWRRGTPGRAGMPGRGMPAGRAAEANSYHRNRVLERLSGIMQ